MSQTARPHVPPQPRGASTKISMARRDASSHHELESTSNKGALRRAKVGRVLRVPPDNIDDGRERVIR